MKPLINTHLQESFHLSGIHVSRATVRPASMRSLKEFGPNAESENSVDVRAAAAMCQYAYSKLSPGSGPEAELIDGWKPMDEFEVNRLVGSGFHSKLKDAYSGFSSMLFHKQANGIQYYAYCTVGTDELIDWVEDFTQAFIAGLSRQYSYSVGMAKQIDSAIGDKAVLWFIGHSLGGGLASNNSLVTGRHAITFNAAGLNSYREVFSLLWNNPKGLFHPIKNTQRVHAFVLEGELLNTLSKWICQEAFGEKHIIEFKDKTIGTKRRHSLTTILDVMGMRYK